MSYRSDNIPASWIENVNHSLRELQAQVNALTADRDILLAHLGLKLQDVPTVPYHRILVEAKK